jgi:hypothetical protein
VRNALIVLIVVALLLVGVGAVNNGLLFDIDFVAGTWTAVSLFWVAVVMAGVLFVTGVVVAFLAASGAVAVRRKLEKELQSTYERLRAAEAKLPSPVPAQAAVATVSSAEQTAITGAEPAAAGAATGTAVEAMPEAETAVTTAAPEAETAVVSGMLDAETAVVGAAPEAETSATAETPAAEAEEAPADAADASPPSAS